MFVLAPMGEHIIPLVFVSGKRRRGRGHKPLVVGFAKDGLLMDMRRKRGGGGGHRAFVLEERGVT
jgi:hypothetical protein